MPDIYSALHALCPNAQWSINNDNYDELVWFPDNVQPKPTLDEINAEIARQEQQVPLNDCKAKAKKLIAATDWAVLPDVNLENKTEFETYRAALRGLITNPVADPVWPTEPQPIWS